MAGFIIFSMIKMKPDIAFAILVAAWFAKNPGYQNTEVIKTILQYLKSSKE